LGKIVHFYASGTTLPENYEIMSIAQPRTDPLDITNSKPLTTIDQFSTPIYENGVGGTVDLSVKASIPQSLDVSQVVVFDSAGNRDTTNASNVGFMPSLDNANSAESGGQTLKLVYAPGLLNSDLPDSPPVPPNSVKKVQNNHLAYAKAVQICLTDGTRFANLRVGYIDDSGHVVNQPTVNIEQRGTSGC
jgi:hypothetical protein